MLMVHSQAGAFGWPVADARPDKVKALLAIEPNGPPFYPVSFTGAPEWFDTSKTMALRYGLTDLPLAYDPPVKDSSDLKIVLQDKADGADLVRGYLQAAPARQLPNLKQMPILVVTAEASYHAPYDHCTVNYLRQAGVTPYWMQLADHGIRGNSHMLMAEKNSTAIADLIIAWANKTVV
jgi:pimeloyl-ACP methyl ester carboxylesterase